MRKRFGLIAVIAAIALPVGAPVVSTGGASTGDSKRYLVVFSGDYAVDSTYAVGGGYAVLCNYAVLSGYAVGCNYAVSSGYAVAHDYAVSLVTAAGGTVASDMLSQVGVLTVDSSNALRAGHAQLCSCPGGRRGLRAVAGPGRRVRADDRPA